MTSMSVDGLLFADGRRLAQGPWQRVGKGLWSVPSVGYMSRCRLSDVVVEEKTGGKWELLRDYKRGNAELDPVAAAR